MRPRLISFWVFLALLLALWAPSGDGGAPDAMAVYTTVFWSLPVLVTAQGLVGALVCRRRVRAGPPAGTAPRVVTGQELVVVVPTVARTDTLGALERVVRSFVDHLPRYFPRLRIDVVIEEGCAGRAAVERLARVDDRIRVVVVPAGFRTPHGTRYKARANHYAHLRRLADGEARDDVWVLHMDDDTAVGPDTAAALADVVGARRSDGSDRTHLVQGVLTYPRELATSRVTWLADAVRPGCDLSIFAAWTGTGAPRAGLHGELLCIRGSVEAAIGWDFGAGSLVEDAEFALRFCRRYPGGSAWFVGRSYGASPATVRDFVRQRARWVRGLLELVARPVVPLRTRLTLVHNIAVWVCAPAGNPVVVLALALLLSDHRTEAANDVVRVVWALTMAFYLSLYWEGLRLNVASSADRRRRWDEAAAVLLLTPVFAVLETLGIVLGSVQALRGRPSGFTVIAKPR